jgi:hypothetical protein
MVTPSPDPQLATRTSGTNQHKNIYLLRKDFWQPVEPALARMSAAG